MSNKLLAALAATVVAVPLAVAAVPNDPSTGRAETCVLDASSGCTVSHGFDQKPTSITAVNAGGSGWASVDPNASTDTTYRIRFTQHTGANFNAGTTARYYVHYDFSSAPPPDTTAPDTTITQGPAATTESNEAAFLFEATETGSTFECKLDAGAWAACSSPAEYQVDEGAHNFQARATDAAGNVDLTPASYDWTRVPPPPPADPEPTWAGSQAGALEFTDEFNDGVVDTAKWETGWFGTGLTDNVNSSNQNCYHTSQVSESDGFLNLDAKEQANFCKGVTRPYTSGIVTTRNRYTLHEGAFEARVCLPDLDADTYVDNFPAWWVNGMASNFTDGEIDLVEGIGQGRTKATVHYGTDPGHTSHGKYSDPVRYTGCHNFGAEWRGTDLKFYWDGVLFFDTQIIVPDSAQLVLIFNHAVDSTHGEVVVPEAPGYNRMKVDWVHAWA